MTANNESQGPVSAVAGRWDRVGLAERTAGLVLLLAFAAGALGAWLVGGPPSWLTVAVVSLVAVAVFAVLRALVSRPLQALADFATALGRGDLSARPPRPAGLAQGPETRRLTAALEAMAEAREAAHRELESQVEARTAELRRALDEATAARRERTAALERLQAIVDSMVDGVIFVDPELRVVLTNKAARAIRSLETTGQPLHDCHPPEAQEAMERVCAYLRDGDDAGPPHSIIRDADGRYETTYAPVRAPVQELDEDEGGGSGEGDEGAERFLGIVMVIRDISDRRTLERRLLDAERLSAVGQMAAQLAHDLRNPLNVIGGATQYLQRARREDDEVQEFAEVVAEQTARVERLVTDLLHVARPAAPHLEPGSVGEAAEDAARLFRTQRGDEGAVRCHVTSGLPRLELDRRMVTEALVNLLQNAVEATEDAEGGDAEGPPEPPELRVHLESEGGAGTVVVEVLDRGVGIDPEQVEDLTRPFVTTKATGTGLGLTIVAQAVAHHRGTMVIEPRDGGGTRVALRFPVRTLREPARDDAEAST